MRVFGPPLISLLVLVLAACGDLPETLHQPAPPDPLPSVGAPAETARFGESLWDDGNAEVARFDARQMRYGEMRDGELILLTVKERFDPELQVKADGDFHAHQIDVMKLNAVLTFQTGVYTYRQMASAFVGRPRLLPLKLATSSQEWCGISSHFLSIRGDVGLFRTFSYFGDEADRAETVTLPGDVVLEDALPVWLRALDFSVATRQVSLVPSQLSNRRTSSAPVAATIRVGASEEVDVPDGSFETRPIEVAWGERRDVYYLEVEPPFAVVRMERGDNVYVRTLLERAPYWRMHDVASDGLLLPPPPPNPASEEPEPPAANED